MTDVKRSLYQCLNAKVDTGGQKIMCAKGHKFNMNWTGIRIQQLAIGRPLVYEVCQSCPDYVEMGPPLAPADCGWLRRAAYGWEQIK